MASETDQRGHRTVSFCRQEVRVAQAMMVMKPLSISLPYPKVKKMPAPLEGRASGIGYPRYARRRRAQMPSSPSRARIPAEGSGISWITMLGPLVESKN